MAAITAEDVTAFRSETSLNFRPVVVTEGVARHGAWVATTTFSEPGSDDQVMRAVSAAGSVWMQMADWPPEEAKCWLAMSDTEVPLGVAALTPGEPAYVGMLGAITATGIRADPSGHSLLATIDLGSAMRLLPGTLLNEIDFDADAVSSALDILSVTVTYSAGAEDAEIERPQESLAVQADDPAGCGG